MKRIIISVLWFPVTVLLIFLSLFILVKKYPQRPASQVNYWTNLSDGYISPTPLFIRGVKVDFRKVALEKFLSDQNSPLLGYIDVLIREADNNGIDYSLIPAIAMQESQGCKIIPVDSYNCWGFGIYGSTVTRFPSYEASISKVARTIKETYIKRGLTNPTLLEDRWAPQSRGTWSYSVNFFISKMREYERNIPDS
jgi:hypothetical protein